MAFNFDLYNFINLHHSIWTHKYHGIAFLPKLVKIEGTLRMGKLNSEHETKKCKNKIEYLLWQYCRDSNYIINGLTQPNFPNGSSTTPNALQYPLKH